MKLAPLVHRARLVLLARREFKVRRAKLGLWVPKAPRVLKGLRGLTAGTEPKARRAFKVKLVRRVFKGLKAKPVPKALWVLWVPLGLVRWSWWTLTLG